MKPVYHPTTHPSHWVDSYGHTIEYDSIPNEHWDYEDKILATSETTV